MNNIVELKQSEADQYRNVHEWLRQELDLPEWYGENLDALWDCVTGHLPKPMTIRWIADSRHESSYSAIVEVFREAADQDDEISFEYVSSP
ncbi:barstar family protein [Paenibacillus nasutitermitis]|uniref:Barstar (barnase inhibitor) domain-containing protein n=1 Tax=Paenibacillus nasutitermitis TaxID=1652958 RepID=A0A916Z8R7_9BACL|nr:barstar family protein [Paenibacillus nasutitermitis]GGD81841.1 hypothetical protein GCM10010911_44950 [Paenibacillus nasutitermitis]